MRQGRSAARNCRICTLIPAYFTIYRCFLQLPQKSGLTFRTLELAAIPIWCSIEKIRVSIYLIHKQALNQKGG